MLKNLPQSFKREVNHLKLQVPFPPIGKQNSSQVHLETNSLTLSVLLVQIDRYICDNNKNLQTLSSFIYTNKHNANLHSRCYYTNTYIRFLKHGYCYKGLN